MKKRLDIDDVMSRAEQAAVRFRQFDQEETDRIVKAAYEAGFKQRVELAKLAHKETRLGVWQHKVIKNVIATQLVYQDIKDQKTVGITAEDREKQIVEIAQPLGPIFAVTPITNPTSTVLFKILIALKSRNPIIFRPHGSARRCSIAAARTCYEAALKAGAPEDCIQWVKYSSKEETLAFMAHKKTALVLATGSVALVRAAYSSGTPAIGVGPGNVPVLFDESADVKFGVEQLLISKTFDNGTICASEQALVVQKQDAEQINEEFKKQKAYFLSRQETLRLEPLAFNKREKTMSVEVIGQPAAVIAGMAGIDVPADTSLLIAPLEEVGLHSPLSLEILAPILALYVVDDFEAAVDMCRRISRHGGLGHTASIFSEDEERIESFASAMNVGRVLVNTPASLGALGGSYNALQPSMTLACGSGGKNITSDNISVRHLLNIKRVARPHVNADIDELTRISGHQSE